MKMNLSTQLQSADPGLSFLKAPVHSSIAKYQVLGLKKIPLLSIKVSLGKFESFINEITSQQNGESFYVCFANVHVLVEAYLNKDFARVVSGANLVTPDGKPLTWALRLLYGLKQERVCGMDIIPSLLQAATDKELPVMFYGGTQYLMERTKEYVGTHYKQLKTAGFISPPFRELTKKEEEYTINQINNSGARIVIVVLGCPKQEKWMASMKGKINAVMVGIGGALPVFVGVQKRAPKWMQESGFEWLFRLLLEPRRLIKRYAVTNTLFVALLAFTFMKHKLNRIFKIR
jgi:N-acetylglucosaminyldiphosphoundecaprenol N-acetyl-beta-D-mannosaminyltransferase